MEDLLKRDLDKLAPEELQEHFAKAGFPDFLPSWGDAEREAITADGKIPSYARWKDQLVRGELGLDALLNISGLCSFVQDQNALDARIRSFL